MRAIAEPPQAPEHRDRRFGGSWTPAQALKNWVIRCCVRALLFGVDHLPRAFLVALGGALGRAARRCLPTMAERARARATQCVPEATAAGIAKECFANAGKNLALCGLLRRADVRAREFVALADDSRAVLSQALAAGRGAIVISAHLGPFEMIPALLVESAFAPAIVVRESYDAELDRVVDYHRRLRGIGVIHRGRKGAALRIVRTLRSGRPVGVLPDLGGRGLTGAPARFLGRTVLFPVSVLRLAQRERCPIVIGTLKSRASGSRMFELVFEDMDTSGSLNDLTQRVAAALGRAIEQSAANWLWMATPHLAIAEDSRSSLSSEAVRPLESGRA